MDELIAIKRRVAEYVEEKGFSTFDRDLDDYLGLKFLGGGVAKVAYAWNEYSVLKIGKRGGETSDGIAESPMGPELEKVFVWPDLETHVLGNVFLTLQEKIRLACDIPKYYPRFCKVANSMGLTELAQETRCRYDLHSKNWGFRRDGQLAVIDF